VITICLCRISGIWLIKQVLNPNKNLLDSNSWSPTLTGEIWKSKTEIDYGITQTQEMICKAYAVLVKNRKADCSRRIDIGVEEALWELALWRLARVILTEMKGKREVSTFPISLPKK